MFIQKKNEKSRLLSGKVKIKNYFCFLRLGPSFVVGHRFKSFSPLFFFPFYKCFLNFNFIGL